MQQTVSPLWARLSHALFQKHQFVYIDYFPEILIRLYSYSLEHRSSPRSNYKSMPGCIRNLKVPHTTSGLLLLLFALYL